MTYEIPKEIKSKPKFLGMELKELVIVIIIVAFIFTVLNDMVHGMFTIPYYIVSGGLLLWCIAPSFNNPGVKNYKSIYFFIKRNVYTYHSLDVQKEINKINFGEEKGEIK